MTWIGPGSRKNQNQMDVVRASLTPRRIRTSAIQINPKMTVARKNLSQRRDALSAAYPRRHKRGPNLVQVCMEGTGPRIRSDVLHQARGPCGSHMQVAKQSTRIFCGCGFKAYGLCGFVHNVQAIH
jgi:hypothetical protein